MTNNWSLHLRYQQEFVDKSQIRTNKCKYVVGEQDNSLPTKNNRIDLSPLQSRTLSPLGMIVILEKTQLDVCSWCHHL